MDRRCHALTSPRQAAFSRRRGPPSPAALVAPEAREVAVLEHHRTVTSLEQEVVGAEQFFGDRAGIGGCGAREQASDDGEGENDALGHVVYDPAPAAKVGDKRHLDVGHFRRPRAALRLARCEARRPSSLDPFAHACQCCAYASAFTPSIAWRRAVRPARGSGGSHAQTLVRGAKQQRWAPSTATPMASTDDERRTSARSSEPTPDSRSIHLTSRSTRVRLLARRPPCSGLAGLVPQGHAAANGAVLVSRFDALGIPNHPARQPELAPGESRPALPLTGPRSCSHGQAAKHSPRSPASTSTDYLGATPTLHGEGPEFDRQR
jgi:hypothetical protein